MKQTKGESFLLKVLNNVVLMRLTDSQIFCGNITGCVARVLANWTSDESWNCCSEILLLCAKTIASRTLHRFVDDLRSAGNQAISNLWTLYMQLEDSILQDDPDRKDILLVLQELQATQ